MNLEKQTKILRKNVRKRVFLETFLNLQIYLFCPLLMLLLACFIPEPFSIYFVLLHGPKYVVRSVISTYVYYLLTNLICSCKTRFKRCHHPRLEAITSNKYL